MSEKRKKSSGASDEHAVEEPVATHVRFTEVHSRAIFRGAGKGGANLILEPGALEPLGNFASPEFAAQLVADGRAEFVVDGLGNIAPSDSLPSEIADISSEPSGETTPAAPRSAALHTADTSAALSTAGAVESPSDKPEEA